MKYVARRGCPAHRGRFLFGLVCFGIVGVVSAGLVPGCGGGASDYAIDTCSSDATPPVKNFWAGANATDVTFLAFGDSQYYLDHNAGHLEDTKNDRNVTALNAVTRVLRWNALGVDAPVDRVRGVIIAGDLTQNGRDSRSGRDNEYGAFLEDYGLCGNRKLVFPVFEGYGNHDYFEWNDPRYRLMRAHPVADSVSARNPYRVGLVNTAPGTDGHYAWEWDALHFVQLNLAPSDHDPDHAVSGVRNPRNALTFLKSDLRRHVAGTSKKVVLIAHYGPKPTMEWDEAQADAFYEVIKNYPVIAYLHGHNHGTSHTTWRGIPIYNVGSPYYSASAGGHFAVFRITDDRIYAADAQWHPDDPEQIRFPAAWSSKRYVQSVSITPP